MSESRKASDILLDLESKIDILLSTIRAQDLNNKIISNKLNEVIVRLDKQNAAPQKIVVEAVQQPLPKIPNSSPLDPERNIPYKVESSLPETSSPQGFRRNSRPETYAGDKEVKLPVQVPQMPQTKQDSSKAVKAPPGRGVDNEMVFPQTSKPIDNKKVTETAVTQPLYIEPQPIPQAAQGQIPVTQRCVDKNGKAIFLANVEIIDVLTNQNIFKARTNGAGKWSASLAVGDYTIIIKKMESVAKTKIESTQNIHVDGLSNKLELPTLIIK
jgi:hypothetical protein